MNRQAVFASSWSISFCRILVFASFGCEGDGEAGGFEAGVGDGGFEAGVGDGGFEAGVGDGGFWEVC